MSDFGRDFSGGERAIEESPRVLIVSPHPDDEVIGAGARLRHMGRAVVVQVTDGAPADMKDAFAAGFGSRADYAAARRGELREALSRCGISRTIELQVPDQEAVWRLNALTAELERLIRLIDPEYVITVPYEGGHPDHDATAFAVHQAVRHRHPPVPIIEMLSYHNENGCCVMDRFLNERPDEVLTVRLTDEERSWKKRLFACFPSQAPVLRWFPVELEKFRLAPVYDFTRPPHSGQLYYEMFPWGLDRRRWCDLVAKALSEQQSIPAAA